MSGMLVVKVKDSGAGLSESQLGQLFQEGVQFDANKLQAGQGSGLGLWISKGVVEKHFGVLKATSEGQGKGSQFMFEIPVFLPMAEAKGIRWQNSIKSVFSIDTPSSKAKQSPLSMTPSSRDTPTDFNFPTKLTSYPLSHAKGSPRRSLEAKLSERLESTIGGKEVKDECCSGKAVLFTSDKLNAGFGIKTSGSLTREEASSCCDEPAVEGLTNMHTHAQMLKILVVDDSASTRKVMARLLKKCGFETIEAGDGLECIDIISQGKHQFDLILMDYEMPIMNGPDATKKLTVEMSCKIPIVGLTGNVMESDAKHFIDHGATEVLTKPLNINSLKDVMKRILHYSVNQNPNSFFKTVVLQPEVLPPLERTGSRKISYISNDDEGDEGITGESGGGSQCATTHSDNTSDQTATKKLSVDVCTPSVMNAPEKVPKVLVVDDVASTRKVICRLLKNCGCETIEAGDGLECIDIISQGKHQFDLILMDYEMPIMNGPDATKKLTVEMSCKIPIVGVTGNVLPADTEHFLAHGALEVLHKPLNVTLVKDLLKQQLHISYLHSPTIRFPPLDNEATKEPSSEKEVQIGHVQKSEQEEEWFMMALNL